MTHGKSDGKVYARDREFNVQELWAPFVGENCPSLIGKPKLFFIQACRGSMTDPGTLFKPKPKARLKSSPDTVDASSSKGEVFVIPTLADLLVMYSTAEGYYSFRNPADGSWFIQAICEELRENPQEDILTILTGVNRRVAFAKQSHVPGNSDWDAMKQMPNILTMLTKTMYFLKRNSSNETLDTS
jgi:caspase 7